MVRLAVPGLFATLSLSKAQLEVATFQVDVTPPMGTPLEYGAVRPAKEVVDPLSARGIVLLGVDQPIVLVSVDWVGIGNGGKDAWRQALARAAGTTTDRVRVHTVHQHDAPGCGFMAERLLEEYGLSGRLFNPAFARQAIERTANAVRNAIAKPQPVTQLGLGRGKVEQLASNRRVLGADGKVKYVRYSSCRNAAARAEPEGVIDPYVRMISFWNYGQPLAVLTFYASHPQSYYGKGGVSADFVGMARSMREKAVLGMAFIHFDGAGGNVAAGKYNDGSPEMRPIRPNAWPLA